jgi:hypothetical protein
MYRTDYEILKLHELNVQRMQKMSEQYRVTHIRPEDKWYLRIPRKLRRLRVY